MASKLCTRALAFLAVASAGSLRQDTKKQFAAFDTDGDGKLNMEEFNNGVHSADAAEDGSEELFHEVDADKDGMLEFEEFATLAEGETPELLELATKSAAQGLLSTLDVDKDGKISLSELVTYSDLLREKAKAKDMKKAWKAFDKDGDGKITFEEFDSTVRHADSPATNETDHMDSDGKKHADHTKEIFSGADSNSDGALDLKEFGALYEPAASPAMAQLAGKAEVHRLDRDGDGLVSQEELPGADDASFAKLDKDGNGKLDASELLLVASGKFRADQAMEEAIREADKDGDGHVSLEELAGAAAGTTGHLAHFLKQHSDL